MPNRRRSKNRSKRAPRADAWSDAQKLFQAGRYQEVINASQFHSQTADQRQRGDWQHIEGESHLALGNHERALSCLEIASQERPDDLSIKNSQAEALFALRRFDEALSVLNRIVAATPDQVEPTRNVVLVLEESGRQAEAVSYCEVALQRWPTDAILNFRLARLHQSLQAWPESAQAFRRCLELMPADTQAHRGLVSVLRRQGDIPGIIAALDAWLQFEPAHPTATHLRAAYAGENVPVRATDAYVEQVFDEFAATFDQQLEALNYRAPQQVADCVGRLELASRSDLVIVDAGCGTGLLAPRLRPLAKRLVGVDLSHGMLDRALTKKIYDELIQTELTDFLKNHPVCFDLITSADTLNYFGDLRNVIGAAFAALKPCGSYFVFTLEADLPTSLASQNRLAEGQAGSVAGVKEFALQPTGRYTHSWEHVRELLSEAGFLDICGEPCVLREEAGREVIGWVCRGARVS